MSEEQLEMLKAARLAHVREALPDSRRLDNYWWASQDSNPSTMTIVATWLKRWYDYQNGEEHARPKPVLHLFGDNNTGKSHLAIGIARFMALNYFSLSTSGVVCDIKRVRWVNHCKNLLSGLQNDINEDVNVLIIDDIDSFRPVPKSMSTYAIEETLNVLKGRIEDAVLPTLITGNWTPAKLETFFSTNSMGESNNSTEQAAKTLWSVIERNTFWQLRFNRHSNVPNTLGLRARAVVENDMSSFDFIPQVQF